MEFTFGIITSNETNYNTNSIIKSIEELQIPHYEIIIVGGKNNYIKCGNAIHVPFDESLKKGWITKKKNIICEMAKYENIVLIHDYIGFSKDWYTGFLQFGNDFDICVSKILNRDGTRFRDYTAFPFGGSRNPFLLCSLLPYNFPPSAKLSRISYISGSYYVIKKELALRFPLDERLCWADGEDVLLTKQLVKNGVLLKFNAYSTVQLLKYKPLNPNEKEPKNAEILKFNALTDSEIEEINQRQINEVKRNAFQRKNILLKI